MGDALYMFNSLNRSDLAWLCNVSCGRHPPAVTSHELTLIYTQVTRSRQDQGVAVSVIVSEP